MCIVQRGYLKGILINLIYDDNIMRFERSVCVIGSGWYYAEGAEIYIQGCYGG